MEKGLSEKGKTKKIAVIVAVILLLLFVVLIYFLLFKKTYQVTFNSNGGTRIVSVEVKDGEKISKPNDPIKEGYIFAGWYYLGELYNFDTPVKQDMTLDARWTALASAEIESITLNVNDLTLTPDGTAVLVAILEPENVEQGKLVWTSSDETIATVDENGNVKAKKEGTVTITVATEDGKYSASCKVNISKAQVIEDTNSNNNNDNNKPSNSNTSSTQKTPNTSSSSNKPSTIEPSSVSISGAKNMTVGDRGSLTARITPSNANSKTRLTWSSSNSGVVSVDQRGNITAVGAGTAKITVTTENGKSASVTITVKAKESVYVLCLTARVMAGTGADAQYDFRVTKDGNAFTDYKGFTLGGETIPRLTGSVLKEVVDKGGKTATIILNDGTRKTATVVVKN